MTAPLILASASPRRKQLLTLLGLPFTVWPTDTDETLLTGAAPEDEVRRLAEAKAHAAPGRGACVVAADTMVVVSGQIMGKPRTPGEADMMLRALRGRDHRVMTGVAVINDGQVAVDIRITRVWMRAYSDATIASYIARGEPFDKAGGYAIQDPVLRPARRLQDEATSGEGCYCNVVGLPLGMLLRQLRQTGSQLPPLVQPQQCAGCPDWATADS